MDWYYLNRFNKNNHIYNMFVQTGQIILLDKKLIYIC